MTKLYLILYYHEMKNGSGQIVHPLAISCSAPKEDKELKAPEKPKAKDIRIMITGDELEVAAMLKEYPDRVWVYDLSELPQVTGCIPQLSFEKKAKEGKK